MNNSNGLAQPHTVLARVWLDLKGPEGPYSSAQVEAVLRQAMIPPQAPYREWESVTLPPAKAGGFYHYQANASWPCDGAIKSGAVTYPLVARFLAAFTSAWVECPQRRQEKSA
jgi:hypothetical protein